MTSKAITKLFGIEYPLVQAGMVWCSGWRLCSAVSNAGGLGLLGAGSMYPETLKYHIQQCKLHTDKPFGVNIPLVYPDLEGLLKVIAEEQVRIVFTSAGNPAALTDRLKRGGVTLVHVVSSAKFALKAQRAGCDAVVAEGFEAGGHNGREETTTFVLLPTVRRAVQIPLIAAGGIATGSQMLAAMVLGADGVQIGSRFVCTHECSAHESFKQRVVGAQEGDTVLSMKQLLPVRLLKNEFYQQVLQAESRGASKEELIELLGKRRSKLGMFEGDLVEGELEIGQVSALLDTIIPAADVVKTVMEDYHHCLSQIQQERSYDDTSSA